VVGASVGASVGKAVGASDGATVVGTSIGAFVGAEYSARSGRAVTSLLLYCGVVSSPVQTSKKLLVIWAYV
jgi:pimeloyl-ACP methyl ester carboxylesterase